MAFGTDDVVMLPVTVRLFVLRQVTAKLMFAHQVILYQQVQGIVHGGPADAVVLVLHADVERLYIKMPRSGIYLLQNSIALRRFAQAFAFQVGGKNLLYLFYSILVWYHVFLSPIILRVAH